MEDMNEQKPPQQPEENNRPLPPPPQQPPQKCPRCDSLNTKFCYYNNYSFSQPRYFCKTCRRYWTQGGTLRNVPVGGGCRKGAKRSRACSSSSSSPFSIIGENSCRSQQLPRSTGPRPQEPRTFTNLGLSAMNSYFSSGGGEFLSSLAGAMESVLSQPPPGFNQVPLNQFGDGGAGSSATSNLALLQGFNHVQPTLTRPTQAHQQFIQQRSDHQILVQPNRLLGGPWTQRFINPPNNHPSSSNTTVSSWTHESVVLQPNDFSAPAASLNNPNHWPDDHLPGYGPPPPS